jgi:hypothetical protein
MLDFPSSPTTNQVFTAPNGTTWVWTGAKWAPTGTTGYLPLAGGTMTGPLIQAADPVQPLGSATKQYVDATNIRYRNRIINGDMSVDQRHGGSLFAYSGAATVYAIDRWILTGAGIGNCGQASGGSSGYSYSLSWATTTAHTVATGDSCIWYQGIEGYNFNDANFGTANAQSFVLEFWAQSSLTGMFAGAFHNGAANRSYVFTFNIAAVNTWQKFRITILGDQAGTWSVAGNALGANLIFNLGAGSTSATAAGAWTAGNFLTAPGAVNPVATLNATLNITGVALMVGAAAANAEPEFKKFSDNLIDCMRYYQKIGGSIAGEIDMEGNVIAGGSLAMTIGLTTKMRAAPTVASLGSWSLTNTGTITFFGGTNSIGIRSAPAAIGNVGLITTATGYLTADADF